MQRAKLFAYVNNNIDINRFLQDKQFHLQLKSKQNVLEEKIQWLYYPQASERACVSLSPLFGQGKIIFFFLMVICNSLLLLKSLPINVWFKHVLLSYKCTIRLETSYINLVYPLYTIMLYT